MTKAPLAVVAAILASFAIAAFPAGAFAAIEIEGFTGKVSNADGTAQNQAGAHPYEAGTTLSFPNHTASLGLPIPDGNIKSVGIDLPVGFLGNPTATPQCQEPDLQEMKCPASSQVGIAETNLTFQTGFSGEPFYSQVYNMEAPDGMPAQFGFLLTGVVVHLDAELRVGGDYGITVDARGLSESDGVYGTTVRLWGVPADASHDAWRGACISVDFGPTGSLCPSDAPKKAFLTNPTNCAAGPLPTNARVSFWQEPARIFTASFNHDVNGVPMAAEGCAELDTEAKLDVQPESSAAGEVTGLEVSLDVRQDGLTNPNGLAPSPIRDVSLTMPEGLTVNSTVAEGTVGCGPAQIALHTTTPASCPNASQIGTIEFVSPLVDHTLPGKVFLATQGTNPFQSLIALYAVVDDPQTGIEIKLPGKVAPDPRTGRLVSTFEDNPQLPFDSLKLRFKGGGRAALVNPPSCGSYESQYSITTWAGQTINGSSSFKIDQQCGRGGEFSPAMQAGTANPVAGHYSSFSLRVTRPDGQQNLSRIDVTLSKGVLAKLAGVQVCGDAGAAAGNCPGASQVGTSTVGVGGGTNPLYVPQAGKSPTAVYLAGPYRGAPYSLVVKVPAQAGPFDLGTVAVRSALRVDPVTTQVTVSSDPLPQILQGIPIDYRDVRVSVDRSEFTVNPTSCDPTTVGGELTSANGKSVRASDRFQVAGCESLALKPKLALKFSGAPTRRGGHPKLTATLTTGQNEANLRQVQVTLPKTEFLENAHIRTVCTRVQYTANQCPAKSVYGYAKAWTPLLDKPLEGPVYLRSSSHKLPDLVASLDGQIHVDLDGRIDSVKRRIRNTFETVPDAPVTKFVLTMQGGAKGLLVNNTQLCKAKPRANVRFDGQNGKLHETDPLVTVAGCNGGKQKR